MKICKNDIILFQGDSVTDCGRDRGNPNGLGDGYVSVISKILKEEFSDYNLTIYNRGVSGNRAADLRLRWQRDCIDLKPTIVTILIGINDVWRRYDANHITSAESFERSYRKILQKVKGELGAKIVMMEPFVNPFPDDRKAWREDLDPKLEVVRKLAKEFKADLISLDEIFAKAYDANLPDHYAYDGVHPTPAGHELIAKSWLEKLEN